MEKKKEITVGRRWNVPECIFHKGSQQYSSSFEHCNIICQSALKKWNLCSIALKLVGLEKLGQVEHSMYYTLLIELLVVLGVELCPPKMIC